MLVTLSALLLMLWVLGLIGLYSLGWFTHLVLVMAIAIFLLRVVYGEFPMNPT